jgi:hypothetical protein
VTAWNSFMVRAVEAVVTYYYIVSFSGVLMFDCCCFLLLELGGDVSCWIVVSMSSAAFVFRLQ